MYLVIKCINKSIILVSFSFQILLELSVFKLFRVTVDDTPLPPGRAWCVSMFPSMLAFITSTCMHNRDWYWMPFWSWAVAPPLIHPPPPLSVHLLLQAQSLLKPGLHCAYTRHLPLWWHKFNSRNTRPQVLSLAIVYPLLELFHQYIFPIWPPDWTADDPLSLLHSNTIPLVTDIIIIQLLHVSSFLAIWNL